LARGTSGSEKAFAKVDHDPLLKGHALVGQSINLATKPARKIQGIGLSSSFWKLLAFQDTGHGTFL
jgi:hypothetical protein